MLLPAELRSWAAGIGLDAPTLDVIEQVRHGDPMRRPRSGTRSVAGRWPSRKMGVTIGYESDHVEGSAVVLMEHDPRVLEIYEQPLVLRLDYVRNGRRVVVLYTPDFLVLETGGVYLDEWKAEEALVQLAARMPERYQRTATGWVAPPAEEAAARLGIRFRLRSSAELSAVLVRNTRFLRDHAAASPEPADSERRLSILERVRTEPGVTAAALLAADFGGADVLWPLVAHSVIWTDLAAVPLAEPARVHLFLDAAQSRAWELYREPTAEDSHAPPHFAAGSALDWNGRTWRIVNAGIDELVLLDDSGSYEVIERAMAERLVLSGSISVAAEAAATRRLAPGAVERLREASESDMAEANRRLGLLRDPTVVLPRRTRARWNTAFRRAEVAYRWGYIGLLPERRSGNTRHRREPAMYKLMDDVIAQRHLVPGAPTIGAAYGALVDECQAAGLTPPSPSTFRRAIKKVARHERDLARLGRRGAYATQPFIFYLGQDTPPHGDYPFQIVHIDHTLLDIELLSRDGRRRLGRPWLTLVMDAFSRLVLAFWLTFDPPSYRSDMMAMRVTVKRHNRLGELYVVDGGADFESVWFEQLLARYEVEKKSRPAAQARFGAVIERLFGISNTELLWSLPGNTKATRNVRMLTPAVDPRRLATLDLGTLHDLLSVWFYDIYNGREHPALGRSPRNAFADGITAAGSRPARLIPYDADFVRDTMPSTARGSLHVRPGAGVKLHHARYWHQDFALAGVEDSDVPVRWDPFDLRHLYAYVGHHWVEAIASSRVNGPALTEREHHLAVEELRQRDRLAGRTASVSERRLATYLASQDAVTRLADQRAADAEVRRQVDELGVVQRDLDEVLHLDLELDDEVDEDEDDEPDEQVVEDHDHDGDEDRDQEQEEQEQQQEQREEDRDRRDRRPVVLGPYT